MTVGLHSVEITPDKSRRRAFTVLELLLAATLLTLIVYVLYSMFDQTQKALHANVAQTGVNEGGRAAMELLVREIESLTSSKIVNGINLLVTTNSTTPIVQDTLDPGIYRTNFMQDVYVLSRFNRDMIGTGFRVLVNTNTPGVGVLSRFSVSTNVSEVTSNNLLRPFLFATSTSTNFQKIVEGVVHLQLTTYDSLGRPQTNQSAGIQVYTNVVGRPPSYLYLGDFLPSYIDVELGVLEPAAYSQIQGMPKNAAQDYLRRQAGKVFMFRKRIAIRTSSR